MKIFTAQIINPEKIKGKGWNRFPQHYLFSFGISIFGFYKGREVKTFFIKVTSPFLRDTVRLEPVNFDIMRCKGRPGLLLSYTPLHEKHKFLLERVMDIDENSEHTLYKE
jgi:hypothetical protein